ncbi:MAG TPA: transcription termination/antitermination NusG family protein, partial [Pyrinomonadaceae bacterium]|nr:transcription termination/antitermination NusG family protein [Pyrinomonadaceae bacterium]
MNASVPILKRRNLWGDINWFALHTKPRHENFAARNVSALGVEAFFPRLEVERLAHGNVQTCIKALFPGYFFARFRPEDSLESVECSRGVLYVVSSGRFP